MVARFDTSVVSCDMGRGNHLSPAWFDGSSTGHPEIDDSDVVWLRTVAIDANVCR